MTVPVMTRRKRTSAIAGFLCCLSIGVPQCVGDDPVVARAGSEGFACFADGSCDPALECVAERCTRPGIVSDGGVSSDADGSADTGADAGRLSFRSCQGDGSGLTDCGASGDCCRSPLVAGGSYSRGSSSATVNDFRLDAYEITVGRFRRFVDAVVGGYRPGKGTGKHAHLNGGGGLNVAGSSDYEQGWDEAWSSSLASTKRAWDTALSCDADYATWTSEVGSSERRPITCATWFEAQAFCTWDGGFLPTEAEWEYVAVAGGGAGYTYPWGSAAPGLNANLAVYGCFFKSAGGACTGVSNIAPVGSVSAGDGKYGQSDLAGNAVEWVLDWYASYPTQCANCANLGAAPERAIRSSSYAEKDAGQLQNPVRSHASPSTRSNAGGARCARSP